MARHTYMYHQHGTLDLLNFVDVLHKIGWLLASNAAEIATNQYKMLNSSILVLNTLSLTLAGLVLGPS